MLSGCGKRPVIGFKSIDCQIPTIEISILNKDQQYLLDISMAMKSGNGKEDLAVRDPGPLSHSRWLTTANRTLTFGNQFYSSTLNLCPAKDDSSKKYTKTLVKSYNQQPRSNGQLCQEISRNEVIIDKNQDFEQKCRKAIREILINGGHEALIASRTNELLTYEAKIAEREAALISIGPCPVMSCTKHHEKVKDVEMDETVSWWTLLPVIFR
ncbi:hypothetical protein AVEN_3739-1 [Araneus ventricosus]|uniref:Uncharacterized protein n=1 Tax=Araneus ventricosus TaxID=182803 RepID=A0A4Y2TMB4_ARAVE|nr:hypothetical protein AVEN_3739-1 [Araneus ventricosus]